MGAVPPVGRRARVAAWGALTERGLHAATVAGVDLLVIRLADEVRVFHGLCTHRGARLAEAAVEGDRVVCAAHGWDYRCATGVSAVDPAESIQRFSAWIDEGADSVWVDRDEVVAWAQTHRPTFAGDDLVM